MLCKAVKKRGGCVLLFVCWCGALRSSRPVLRPGQAVAAAGHPFAAGGGGMMGCAVLVGGVNQSGDRARLGVMTCTTRADLLPVCGSYRTRLRMVLSAVQGTHMVVTQRVVDVADLLASGGHDADIAASLRADPGPERADRAGLGQYLYRFHRRPAHQS